MADRSISVQLKADVAKYMSEMKRAGRATSDLEKETLKVQSALSDEADAAGRVRVAQERLNEVRGNGKATSSQLAAAEEQLATAMRNHEEVRERAILIGDRYIQNQRSLTDATGEAEGNLQSYGRATEKVAKRANVRFRLLASTIGTLLPAASSAAVGALTGGVGAGFIALGAVGVRESDRVRDAWSALGEDLSDKLASDASVLEGAFVDAANEIGGTYDRLRPQLQQAFAESVPAVGQLTDGVTGLATNAMPGLLATVEASGPVFAGLQTLLEQTGTSVGDFLEELSTYSSDAGEGFEHLGTLIDEVLSGTAPILGHLTQLWAEHGDQFSRVLGDMLDTIGNLTGSALPAFSGAIGSALTILEAILAVVEPMATVLGPAVGAWLSLAAAMKVAGRAKSAITGLAAGTARVAENSSKMSKGALLARGGMAAAAVAAYTFYDAAGSLNPEIAKAAQGLETFASTGKASGEAARLFGEDMSGLGTALETVNKDGLAGFAESVTQTVGDLVGIESTLGLAEDQVKAFDEALASMVESGNSDAAFKTLQEAADATGVSVSELREQLPGYKSALGETASSYEDVAESTDKAAAALERYLEQQRAATDPVFALNKALRDVDEAQRSYDEAVKKHGANSAQARSANWALAEAISGAEQAALDGDLSFEEFDQKLQDWVAQGKITSGQADDIRDRVKTLRGEAEDYRGNYGATATMDASQASDTIDMIVRKINGIPRTVTTRHNVTTHYSSTGRRMGVQNSAGEWVNSGGGYADGGLVGFPTGGMVRGPGGPRTDSIAAMLSNGEFVVNARATQDNLSLLQAINAGSVSTKGSAKESSAVRGAPSAGVGGGSVSVVVNAPNYVGSHQELIKTLRRAVQTGGGSVQAVLGRG